MTGSWSSSFPMAGSGRLKRMLVSLAVDGCEACGPDGCDASGTAGFGESAATGAGSLPVRG